MVQMISNATDASRRELGGYDMHGQYGQYATAGGRGKRVDNCTDAHPTYVHPNTKLLCIKIV